MTPIAMPLTAIRLDSRTHVRFAIDEDVVATFAARMAEGVAFPPVAVFYDDDGYYLVDGFHRYHAARRLGLPTLLAEQHHGNRSDALWFALGANRLDGTPLNARDKQRAMELALFEWELGGRAKMDIAAQIGVGDRTLREHAARLAAAGRLRRLTVVAPRVVVLPAATAPAAVKPALTMPDRSPAALQARHAQMRELAASQHSTRQIAAAVGLSWGRCRYVLKQLAIDVPADRVMGKTQRHSATRIVDTIVMDAVNLTEGADLIDFSTLDRSQIAEWVRSLQASREQLGTFIRRLIKEQTQHGDTHEAA